VATLHHGWLPTGAHKFSWRVTRDDDPRAPNGVYFVRAVAGGKALSLKVELLRGR